MRTRRQITAILASLLALTPLTACGTHPAQPNSILSSRITVGIVTDAEGFDTGDLKPSGFDIDVMNTLGTQLKAQMVPTLTTYADRESDLLSGRTDLVIATYSITPQRNHAGIDFAGPYMVSPQALLVRADNNKIAKKDDLKGKTVCAVEGSTAAETNIPGATATLEQTTHDCVGQLNQGNTDAVFTNSLILSSYTHASPNKYKVVLPGVFGEIQYLGVGLKSGHHADCETIDRILSNFLNTQWTQDFAAQFPGEAAAYSGSDTSQGNFASVFKPTVDDMSRLSCKL